MPTKNPLIENEGLPHFNKIEASHIEEAVSYRLRECEQELINIEKEPHPSWETIIEPIDGLWEKIHRTWGPVSHLHGTKNSDELRNAYQKMQPRIVEFGTRFQQSKQIYEALKKIKSGSEWSKLQPAQKRVIDLNLKDAELGGIALEGDTQKRFNMIVQELSKLSTAFSNNVLDATKAFSMTLTQKDEVDGLPESFLAQISQAHNQAQSEECKKTSTPNLGPWRIGLDVPSYVPFMKFANHRGLRKKLLEAQIARSSEGPFDNTEKMLEILKLRREKAKILGFQNYAELSLARKMAPTVDAVRTLLEELRFASLEPGRKEIEDLIRFAKANGFSGTFDLWDTAYWSEKFREQKFGFSEEELKPYFALPNVLNGLFALSKKIFRIDVRAADGEAEVWHQDVRYFKVYDENENAIAAFFLDPYSRPENKRGGAWMDDCLGRYKRQGRLQTPVAYLVCNGAAPVGNTPSLLSFRDVETLFHEFGHGLQHMLTRVNFAQVSGINGIEWDAVELPSQFMENWCYHKETLLGLAKHYQTGKTLPEHYFDKLQAARTFQAAVQILRQLKFAMTDIEIHSTFDLDGREDIFAFSEKIAAKTSLIDTSIKDRVLCSFSHIFAGGYAAGYYSYKWAEVLSADAFSAFEDAGLDDERQVREIGMRFRETVLALGGSQDPMEVFIAFRGRKPSPDALLRHAGLKP